MLHNDCTPNTFKMEPSLPIPLMAPCPGSESSSPSSPLASTLLHPSTWHVLAILPPTFLWSCSLHRPHPCPARLHGDSRYPRAGTALSSPLKPSVLSELSKHNFGYDICNGFPMPLRMESKLFKMVSKTFPDLASMYLFNLILGWFSYFYFSVFTFSANPYVDFSAVKGTV